MRGASNGGGRSQGGVWSGPYGGFPGGHPVGGLGFGHARSPLTEMREWRPAPPPRPGGSTARSASVAFIVTDCVTFVKP
jgi:hypothetical protein